MSLGNCSSTYFCCADMVSGPMHSNKIKRSYYQIPSFSRFGYGHKGKALEAETTVVRGPCVFHTNGNMTINSVVYPPRDPMTADGMADAQVFQEAFDSCVSELAGGDDDATPSVFVAWRSTRSTKTAPTAGRTGKPCSSGFRMDCTDPSINVHRSLSCALPLPSKRRDLHAQQ